MYECSERRVGEGICPISVSTSACMNDSVRCFLNSEDCHSFIANDLTIVLSTLMLS